MSQTTQQQIITNLTNLPLEMVIKAIQARGVEVSPNYTPQQQLSVLLLQEMKKAQN